MARSPVRIAKRLILHAEIVTALAFARALIRFLPLRYWRRLAGPMGSQAQPVGRPTARQIEHADTIGRRIRGLARRVPFSALCFPQALAGRWVLNRRGIPSRIQIGSWRADSASELELHAWLMVGETVVTGREEYEKYRGFVSR